MASSTRDRDREQLEQGLLTDEYEGLLKGLQVAEPSMRGFGRWLDVVGFMRTGPATDPRKDEVLLPLFRAYRRSRDPRLRCVLLAAFWGNLESIDSYKRRWDPDPDERWGSVMWAFLRAIDRLDVSRRPARLTQKVVNDTIHDLYLECQRHWDRSDREITTDPDEIAALAAADVIDLDEVIDLRAALDRETCKLQAHRDAGRITEADFLLGVGCLVYHRPVASYARAAGLGYELVKKRRQRLVARLRRLEEAMR